MICILDNDNKIINIVNAPYPTAANERIGHPWNMLWEQYSEIPPLDYLKQQKLAEIAAWTAAAITGGFVSSCSGQAVRYDSDKDTQLTMQGIALNVDSPLFTSNYPNGCPVRGCVGDSTEKTIQMLTAAQVMQWQADLSLRIGAQKQRGWTLQTAVSAATTAEELEKITWESGING